MKHKGLGRGLDAIFGSDFREETPKMPTTENETTQSNMNELEINEIAPNPSQPRTEFNDEALNELADSIRQLGVIQPITVKRGNNHKYIIISGERRWRAAQRAGLKTIPAYLREVDDEDLYAMALVENIQRQDLNAIEVALGMQRLIDECHLTQDSLSEKVGKKRSSISNYLRLLRLPGEIQLAVKENLISMGHAKAIAGAAADEQIVVLKKCLEKDLSVRQVEDLVRRLNEQPQEKPQVEECPIPESFDRLRHAFERVFVQKLAIKPSKKGGGRIVIDFKDDHEIEDFINRFGSQA